MTGSLNKQSRSGKRSFGVAFVFALIAVVGMALMFSNPPSVSELQPEEKPNSAEPVGNDQELRPNYSSYVLRTVAITAILVIIILMVARVYRNRMRIDASHKLNIKILGRKYIGPKQFLLVAYIDGHKLLLGVTDNSIHLIKEYEADNSEDLAGPDNGKISRSFTNILKQFTTGGNS